MTLADAIHQRLLGIEPLVAAVGKRIHWGWLPDRAELPCVTLLMVGQTSMNGAAGPTGTKQCRLQVDVWARRPSEARTIADAIEAALGGWSREAAPKISPISPLDRSEEVETPEGGGDPLTRISQDFSVWIYQAVA